jgi:endonuclease-3
LRVPPRRSKPLPAPPHSSVVTRRILRSLERHHPAASTELVFRNAFELLAATILSAQCTDQRVNQVTPELFARYPNPGAMAMVEPEGLESLIRSTGFFRAKARSLVGMARAVVERHGGEIPADLCALVALPGVGRKTANVVLGHALGVPGFPVDRHVLRVANRLGIAHSADPVVVEHQLGAALPPARWTLASDTLILHGRRICKPRPLCDRCHARGDCLHLTATPSSVSAPDRRAGGAPSSFARPDARGAKKR